MGWLSSPKPDKNIGLAAREAQALSREALEWAREEFEATAPDRAAAQLLSERVANANINTLDNQNQIAREERAYQTSTFRPLERKLIDQAEEYNSEGRREAEAGRAGAEVQQAIDTQLGGQARYLQRVGVNPNSGKFATMQNATAVQGALGQANAKDNARRAVETQGFARMADVANLGRGLSSSQNAAVATGLNAGSASTAASGFGLNARQSGASLMQNGFNTALSGLGTAGNLYSQARPQGDGGFGELASGIGGLATGAAALGWMPFSDEKMKKNTKKPANTASMLDAVKRTPVKADWQYDAKKGGPDDGMTRDGPMAQDVRANMGEAAAPGGKVLDLITMNGVTMGAIQELAKRMDKMERMAA